MTLTDLKRTAPDLYAFIQQLKAHGINGKVRNVRIK